MAKYIYSIPKQTQLDMVKEGLKKLPAWERDCLPEALRQPIKKGILSIIRNSSPVCIDPNNGQITIDQLRLNSYKKKFKDKEREIRESVIGGYIQNAPSPIKEYAEQRTKGLRWYDDNEFRNAVEDIVVMYDTYSMCDPQKYPPYGTLFRYDNSLVITPEGIRKEKDLDCDPSLHDYFRDMKFMAVHMQKVRKQYDELTAEFNASAKAKAETDRNTFHAFNFDFYDAFNKISGMDGRDGR